MPVIIAGIDPSLTSTGVAVLDAGRLIHRSHHGHRGTKGDGYLIRNRRIRYETNAVRKVLDPYEIDLAVIEILPTARSLQFGRDDRATINNGIVGYLDHRGVPIVFILPNSAKAWATGNGRADKDQVLAEVNHWWPGHDIVSDDEADAIVQAEIGAYRLGEPLPFTIQRRHPHIFDVGDWSALNDHPSLSCVKPEPSQVNR